MWFRCSIVLFGALLVEWPALVQSFEAKCHVKYHIHSRVNSTSVTWKQAKDVSKEKSFFIASYRLNFDPIRPTRIFVHGYKSDTDLMDSYAQAYLNAGNFNFIAVDWLAGASTWNYLTAKDRVPEVGKALATFIDHLVNELGMQLHDLILVGHSLGAHVCGWAGKSVKTGKLPVIIGLDPALPGFEIKNGKKRLNHTDASYVQIIHTSGGFFGIKTPLGHSDFYINYGCKQPGCSGMTSRKHLFDDSSIDSRIDNFSFSKFQKFAHINVFTIYSKRVCTHRFGPNDVNRMKKS